MCLTCIQRCGPPTSTRRRNAVRGDAPFGNDVALAELPPASASPAKGRGGAPGRRARLLVITTMTGPTCATSGWPVGARASRQAPRCASSSHRGASRTTCDRVSSQPRLAHAAVGLRCSMTNQSAITRHKFQAIGRIRRPLNGRNCVLTGARLESNL